MKASEFLAVVFACLALAPAPLSAQDTPTPVTVLTFAERGGASGLGTDLYNALRTQIEFHRGYRLNDVPPQSLDDLLMAVGCAELDRACSSLVADVVGTRYLAWGEVTTSDATITVRMTLWDLETAQPFRTRSHIVGRAYAAVLLENDQMIGRSILYGNEGTLTVDALPAGARVDVAGYGSGVTPFVADDIPFGFYTVTVESEGYETSREVVVVDVGGAVHTPVLRGRVAERTPREGPSMNPAVAQWTLVGLGTASAVAGVVFGVQKNQTQSEFDDVTGQREMDRARAESLREDGERQARLSNVFVGVGAGLVVTGIVWKIVAPGRHEDAEDPWVRVGGFARGRDGAGLTLDVDF